MGQRPAHLKAPEYLSKSPPVPQPDAAPRGSDVPSQDEKSGKLDPTRYGDWERNGIAVDF
jgi:hypothetical protein